MTRYYIYIDAGATLDTTAKFYRVKVGTTTQMKRDLQYLTEYANRHGHYFKLWSSLVVEFLTKIADSFPHSDGECYATILDLNCVSARELVRHFKHGDALTLDLNVEVNSNHLREYLSINYRINARRHR